MKGGLKKMDYIEHETQLKKLLNYNRKIDGNNPKGYSIPDEVIKILEILKHDFKKELSTKFLFNLLEFNDNKKEKIQKINRFRRLINRFDRYKTFYFRRYLDVLPFKREVIEYGFNKWGEACIKKIHVQQFGKECLRRDVKRYTFIDLN